MQCGNRMQVSHPIAISNRLSIENRGMMIHEGTFKLHNIIQTPVIFFPIRK